MKAIGCCKLLSVTTNFFDDFTVLASKANSNHVGLVVFFCSRNGEGKLCSMRKRMRRSLKSLTSWGYVLTLPSNTLDGCPLEHPRQTVVCTGDVSDSSNGPVALTEVQMLALRFLQKRVLDGRSRCFSCKPCVEACLWIDGACEWDVSTDAPVCGFGGVESFSLGTPLLRGALSCLTSK